MDICDILAADDNESWLDGIIEAINRHTGYSCDTARNYEETSRKISTTNYRLIILNYGLGTQAQGRRILRLLADKVNQIPVLLISGSYGYSLERISSKKALENLQGKYLFVKNYLIKGPTNDYGFMNELLNNIDKWILPKEEYIDNNKLKVQPTTNISTKQDTKKETEKKSIFIPADKYRSKIDFGIITIREDENNAVLRKFKRSGILKGKNRSYILSRIKAKNNNWYNVAIIRCIGQGGGISQDTARDMIEDLDPNWIILVGIAGGIPAYEYTLGDVVTATDFLDFSIEAVLETGKKEYAAWGAQLPKIVTNILNVLDSVKEMQGWNWYRSIGMKRPNVDLSDDKFYGHPEWKEDTKKKVIIP